MEYLAIREIFRYPKPHKRSTALVDDYRNHFFVTDIPNQQLLNLESGINPIAEIKAIDDIRRPAILIRSSPHKIGSETTPWQDVFDVDNGHIRYYGDNKTPGADPSKSKGNKILLEAFETYNNSANRILSTPLIFYKAVTRNNKSKGYIEFNGFGIIKGIELITQYDRKLDRTFSNYAFDFHVFSLTVEKELFCWEWINQRRDNILRLNQTLSYAPASWKDWISKGSSALEKNRRRVSKLLTIKKEDQIPIKGSKEEKLLLEVYKYYQFQKSKFEGLASAITQKILKDNGNEYDIGWITPPTSDGGIDFYGRIDIGKGFGKAKLIVLGQAKCEKLDSPTGGNHIARTVARLRRGWIGVYVTTSYFSESVQREIIEDEYPIMLINGLNLSQTLLKILHDEGYSNLKNYLDYLEVKYTDLVQTRRPDELLHYT